VPYSRPSGTIGALIAPRTFSLRQSGAAMGAMALDLSWTGSAGDVEDRLAVRCREGESAAFDELIERYQLRLFRFAYRLLKDRVEAEDAVQETFIRSYKALTTYRPDGYFSSWIYRICLNECRRRMRSRKTFVPLELAPPIGNLPDPQQVAMQNERHRLLRGAVDSLPEHYRVVMMLFYFEDMPVDLISRTLSVSVSAVKVRLHRGRERLSHRLEGVL
jgi:RNA polymerase sigma-70 factor (ECF subfamily)